MTIPSGAVAPLPPNAENLCEGTTCGVPGTVRELRQWADVLEVSRFEFYGVLAALTVAVLVGITIWKFEGIGRVLNERSRIRLDNRRQAATLQQKLENVKQARKGRRK